MWEPGRQLEAPRRQREVVVRDIQDDRSGVARDRGVAYLRTSAGSDRRIRQLVPVPKDDGRSGPDPHPALGPVPKRGHAQGEVARGSHLDSRFRLRRAGESEDGVVRVLNEGGQDRQPLRGIGREPVHVHYVVELARGAELSERRLLGGPADSGPQAKPRPRGELRVQPWLEHPVPRAGGPVPRLVQQVQPEARLHVVAPCPAERAHDTIVQVDGARRHRVQVVEAPRPVEALDPVEAHLRGELDVELVSRPGVPLAPQDGPGADTMIEAEPSRPPVGFEAREDLADVAVDGHAALVRSADEPSDGAALGHPVGKGHRAARARSLHERTLLREIQRARELEQEPG